MPDPPSRLDSGEVLDLLASLVQKSLVLYEEDEQGRGRYRLMEMVRHYARDRMSESGEAERVGDRHLGFFLELAERAEPELHRHEQVPWLDRLEAEHDNLRAALEWCEQAVDSGQWVVDSPAGQGPKRDLSSSALTTDHQPLTTAVEAGLRLTDALAWFWLKRNHFAEGRRWLEQALRVPACGCGQAAPAALRVKALQALGIVYRFCGEPDASRSVLEGSLALARAAGDRHASAYSLFQLGIQALWSNDGARAKRLGEESLALAREVGDPWLLAHPLHLLGMVAAQQGDRREAIRLFEESLCLTRGIGDKFHMGMTLGFLAIQMGYESRHEEARSLHVEEITLGQELKDKRMIAWGLEAMSWVAGRRGDAGREREAWVRAARLMGAAEALFAPFPLLLPPPRRSLHDQTVAVARAALGEEALAAAWAEGRAMPLEQAIALALEESDETTD